MSIPNVLLISVDSLRSDFCSFINKSEKTTPFLREFAQDCAVYTYGISPSTWTLQSHASLFTGLYPPEHQVIDKNDVLGSHKTIAERANAEGYECCSFAANGWFNTGGIVRGFDHKRTLPPTNIGAGVKTTVDGFAELDFEKILSGMDHVAKVPIEKIREKIFRDNYIDTRTLRNFETQLDRSGEPFFHFIHLNGVHNPYIPHIKHYREFGRETTQQIRRTVDYQHQLADERVLLANGTSSFDRRHRDVIEDLYRGSVHQTDSVIEQTIETLAERDVLENTVIAVFGDHGDELGSNGLWGHQFSVSNEVIRVPLLIFDPTNTVPAHEHSTPVQLNDLYPTILDLIDADYKETKSQNIVEERRTNAFTYYFTPESFLEQVRIDHELADQDIPPTKQFAVWRGPSERATWYPDSNESEGDDELLPVLKDHYENLERVKKERQENIDGNTLENLRDMGYIN